MIRANFSRLRIWLNGAVALGDIAAAAVDSGHIFKTEHYPGPLGASLGTTGDVFSRRRSFDKANRSYSLFDLTTGSYSPVPNMATTIYLEGATNVEVAVRFYAWGLPSDPGAGGDAVWGVTALVRLFHGSTGTPSDDTAVQDSTRRIALREPHASGTYSPVIYTYDKKPYSISTMLALGAGYHHIYLAVRCFADSRTAPRSVIDDSAAMSPAWGQNHYEGVVIEGRSLIVEIHTK